MRSLSKICNFGPQSPRDSFFEISPLDLFLFSSLCRNAVQLSQENESEPRKGGFSKGGFCRVQGQAQGHKKYQRALGPAMRLALTASRPREAYIFAKTHFSWLLIRHLHKALLRLWLAWFFFLKMLTSQNTRNPEKFKVTRR